MEDDMVPQDPFFPASFPRHLLFQPSVLLLCSITANHLNNIPFQMAFYLDTMKLSPHNSETTLAQLQID